MCDVRHEDDGGTPRSGITDLVDELTVALTNARIYSKDHPRVRSSITSLVRCLGEVAGPGPGEPIVLGTADKLLIHEGKALLRASLSSARLIEALEACRAGALSIDGRASEQEVVALVGLLAASRKGHRSIDEANADLRSRGGGLIRFLPRYRAGRADAEQRSTRTDDAPPPPSVNPSIAVNVPVTLYQETVTLLQDSAMRVCHGDDVDLDGVRGFVESILGKLASDGATMMGLARYERYDAYTFGHSIRVCFIALGFAGALFDDERLLLRIGLASLLHDIGKARVPFEVLHSTKRLTPEERVEMNKHTTHGAEILLRLPEVDPLAVATAFGHHQTLSGGGYPATIHRSRPSIATQIVKICDVYEALTAVRPYKARMSPVRAYRIMMSMRDHFDPALLRRFIDINGIYPVGSLVGLSTGEHARVVRQSADPLAPVVQAAPAGRPAPQDPDAERDLSQSHAADRARVVEFVDDAA